MLYRPAWVKSMALTPKSHGRRGARRYLASRLGHTSKPGRAKWATALGFRHRLESPYNCGVPAVGQLLLVNSLRGQKNVYAGRSHQHARPTALPIHLMAHVFISYVRENQDVVDRLCASLRTNQIEVWLDREQIQPGQRWRDAIRSAIRNGAFFLACFSRESTARERSYMNDELTLAIDELRLRPTSRSWFIPVLLSGSEVPDRNIGGGETLRDFQWVDLAAGWDDGIRAIVRTTKECASLSSGKPAALSSGSRADERRDTGSSSGLTFKPCIDCKGLGLQRAITGHSPSGVAHYSAGPVEPCSTCRGTGEVPSSMRRGLLGLRNLVDCWNCGRTGIAYNNYYTHCPGCGTDLFPQP